MITVSADISDVAVSLWDSSVFLNSTPGVIWLAEDIIADSVNEVGGDYEVRVVDNTQTDSRASELIDPAYVVGGITAYVSGWQFRTEADTNSDMRFRTADQPTHHGESAGPQLTENFEDVAGMAILLPDGTVYKWTFPQGDEVEAYTFTAAEVAAAGDANTIALRAALRLASSLDLIIVDRTHPAIDWDDLTYTAGTTAPSLPAAPAEILQPLVAHIDGAARWPGGMMAEVETYRASMFGGPDTATLNVTGPEPGLRWLLTQIRRPLHVRGQQAGLVWWGYIHRIELRLGAILITVSLDGYRTAIAVRYLQDGQDVGLRTGFHVEQPVATQYGRIELLGAEEPEAPTGEALADLLDPYLNISRAMEVSRQPATGARVFCRGWSAALEWRHVPRYHESARIGDATSISTSRGEYGSLPSGLSHLDGDDLEWAAWLDFDDMYPDFDLYMSVARLTLSGAKDPVGAGYSDDRYASIWKRDRTDVGDPESTDPPSEQIGDEIEFSASGLPIVQNTVPTPAPFPYEVTGGVDLDFSQQDLLLPEAGFYIVIRGTLTNRFRWGTSSITIPSARWTWARTAGSGTWTSAGATIRPAFDFFTRCRGQGLLRLLLSDHDILHAGATPDDVGERSYAVYLEGVSTIAHHVQQVQDVEQLAYAIGPARGVHFFASGTRTYELGRSGVWRSAVARGSMAFLGQYVTVTATGEKSICEGAVFTPRTGLWDLSFRALPTASELVSTRRSAQRIARQGP